MARNRVRAGDLRAARDGLSFAGAAGALLLGACSAADGAGVSRTSSGDVGGATVIVDPGRTSGLVASGGASSALIGAGGETMTAPCAPADAGVAVFSGQVVRGAAPWSRDLYSWTTKEQAAELRAGRVLLTREEREGLGPGYAIDYLTALAKQEDAAAPLVAQVLERFKKARYAWPNPWATRMGWPGESYGGDLIRIRLKPEAWIVVVQWNGVNVLDSQNRAVTIDDARMAPERVGAVYFVRTPAAGGPRCGSFTSGGNGYREFIVGNEAMVEEWSLGTAEICDRILSDKALLEEFLRRIRSCPETSDSKQWNAQVACSWEGGLGQPGEIATYEQSLAMPSPGYIPTPSALVTLIETLRGDLFDPSPLIVTPGR